mgnify:CR=1 FL=1
MTKPWDETWFVSYDHLPSMYGVYAPAGKRATALHETMGPDGQVAKLIAAAPAMARLLCRFEGASGDGLYRLCCRSADKPHMPGCPLDACLTAIGISPEERERVRF